MTLSGFFMIPKKQIKAYSLLLVSFLLLLQGCSAEIRTVSNEDSLKTSASNDTGEKPTISISSSVKPVTSSTEIPFTIKFESPVKFKDSDLTVSGGRVFQCKPNSSVSYSCVLIPDNKNVSVQIVTGSIRKFDGSQAGFSNVLSFVVAPADKVFGLCFKSSEFYEKYQSMRF